MSTRCITVPIAQREATRAALLQELAARLGRPCGTGGYTGMAGVKPGGALAAPGDGETLQACEERLSRDGTEVAFILDGADGAGLVLRNPVTGAEALRMRDLAGTRVRGRDLPAARVVDERTYFPDPVEDPDDPREPRADDAGGRLGRAR